MALCPHCHHALPDSPAGLCPNCGGDPRAASGPPPLPSGLLAPPPRRLRPRPRRGRPRAPAPRTAPGFPGTLATGSAS